jgi:hypothetical protein
VPKLRTDPTSSENSMSIVLLDPLTSVNTPLVLSSQIEASQAFTAVVV